MALLPSPLLAATSTAGAPVCLHRDFGYATEYMLIDLAPSQSISIARLVYSPVSREKRGGVVAL